MKIPEFEDEKRDGTAVENTESIENALDWPDDFFRKDPDLIGIITAKSCKARPGEWTQNNLTWKELCERLNKPVKTALTIAEYAADEEKSKAERKTSARKKDKDVGGFVGGYLRDSSGGRTKDNIAARTLFTGDFDACNIHFFDAVMNGALKFKYAVYTTFSHTPANPRIRVIAPLNRECKGDEYEKLALQLKDELETLSDEIQMENEGVLTIAQLTGTQSILDESARTPEHMMFWPATPADGKFDFKDFDGDLLDVDALLARREAAVNDPKIQAEKTQKIITRKASTAREKRDVFSDPRTAPGIEGLFNRRYTIKDILENQLKGVYIPTDNPDRWTFAKGSTEKGLAITGEYDGRLAFSHHGTDIAHGRPLTPFSLLQIHLYNDSRKETEAALKNDPGIAFQAQKERAEESRLEYADDFHDEDDAWKTKLKINDDGTIQSTLQNCTLILENDPLFRNIALNVMSDVIEVIEPSDGGRPVPWTRENDDPTFGDRDRAQMIELLDALYANFPDRVIDISLTAVTTRRKIHPVRDFLDGLPEWDGVERLDTLLIRYLKAVDNPYIRAATRKALTAAIKRIYEPGCQSDYILVLNGAQGIGKSSIIRDLVKIVGERYYCDSLTLTDMDDKKAAEKLLGAWIVEICELAGLAKMDLEKTKAFITRRFDKFRPAYGRFSINVRRKGIMFATVNGSRGYLKDPTGDRRFWDISCEMPENEKIEWNISDDEKRQIWAEAKHRYKNGEKLYMDSPELKRLERIAQSEAREVDDRLDILFDYLEKPLPEAWHFMNVTERRDFLAGVIPGFWPDSKRIGIEKRMFVTPREIWTECFKRDDADFEPRRGREIANLMRSLSGSWEYVNIRVNGKRIRRYQRIITEDNATASESYSSESSQPRMTSDEKISPENLYPLRDAVRFLYENKCMAEALALIRDYGADDASHLDNIANDNYEAVINDLEEILRQKGTASPSEFRRTIQESSQNYETKSRYESQGIKISKMFEQEELHESDFETDEYIPF